MIVNQTTFYQWQKYRNKRLWFTIWPSLYWLSNQPGFWQHTKWCLFYFIDMHKMKDNIFEGFALTTLFAIKCIGWLDEGLEEERDHDRDSRNNNPLMYEYWMIQPYTDSYGDKQYFKTSLLKAGLYFPFYWFIFLTLVNLVYSFWYIGNVYKDIKFSNT